MGKRKKSKNFLNKYKKEIPLIAAFLAIIAFLILTVPSSILKLRNWVDNTFLFSRRIYLNLAEQDWKIQLDRNYQVITILKEIKENVPVILRFSLTQNNKDAPEITTIFINFHLTAEVTPISYKGWSWERTNAPGNQYSLDCSYPRLASGSDWDLPPFDIKFKEVGLIPFKYSIVGNKMNKIERKFVIDTRGNYQEVDNPEGVTIFLGMDTRNTATPELVKVETFSLPYLEANDSFEEEKQKN